MITSSAEAIYEEQILITKGLASFFLQWRWLSTSASSSSRTPWEIYQDPGHPWSQPIRSWDEFKIGKRSFKSPPCLQRGQSIRVCSCNGAILAWSSWFSSERQRFYYEYFKRQACVYNTLHTLHVYNTMRVQYHVCTIPWGFPIPSHPKSSRSQSRAHSGSPSGEPQNNILWKW